MRTAASSGSMRWRRDDTDDHRGALLAASDSTGSGDSVQAGDNSNSTTPRDVNSGAKLLLSRFAALLNMFKTKVSC
jgi:hypothetical protein